MQCGKIVQISHDVECYIIFISIRQKCSTYINKKLSYHRVHLTSLYCMVQKAFRYVKPFKCDHEYDTDRGMDGRTGINTKLAIVLSKNMLLHSYMC